MGHESRPNTSTECVDAMVDAEFRSASVDVARPPPPDSRKPPRSSLRSSYQNSRSADEDLGCSNIFERISIWGDTKFVSWAEADEPLVGTREAPLPPFGPRIPYSSALPPLV